jgi:hypothetical protein
LVGQQILLQLRVTGDGPLPPGRLIPPEIQGADLMLLHEARSSADPNSDSDGDGDGDSNGNGNGNGDSNRHTNASGERWFFEQRYAVFPRSAGQLEIPAAVYSAWHPGAIVPEERRSAPLAIEIQPATPAPPGASPDRPWLPATEISLSEAGSSLIRLAPEQAVERLLTLKAVGLRAEDLPPIGPPIPAPLQAIAEPPRLWNQRLPTGVIGHRSERITVSSAEPGSFQAPAVSLDWWNLDTQAWEQAKLPEWQLQVAAFDSSTRRPAPDWRRDGAEHSSNGDSDLATTTAPKPAWLILHWPWISGLIGLVGLAGLLALLVAVWRRRSRALAASEATPRHQR